MSEDAVKYDRKVAEHIDLAKTSEEVKMYGKLINNDGWKYFKKELIEQIKTEQKELNNMKPVPKLVGEIPDKLMVFEQESTSRFAMRVVEKQARIAIMNFLIDYPKTMLEAGKKFLTKSKEAK